MRPRRVSSAALALALLAAGCGGGGGHAASGRAHRRGQARLTILWPARSTARLIPAAANSVTVTLRQGTTVVGTKTVPRPAASGATTSEVDLDDLPYATLAVTAQAFPGNNGDGVAQAAGAGAVTVVAGSTAALTVSLASTVASISIPAVYPPVGGTATLVASAKDAQGNLVLLATGGGQESLAWTSDAPGVATVAGSGPTATLTGVASGTAHVTATFVTTDGGATVAGTGLALVGFDPHLAVGGYPMTHGDPGHTGQGSGHGATGTLAWTAPAGSAAVSTIVVGPDGNVYAASGTMVTAFDASGAQRWQATLMRPVKGLLLTRDGQLYVGANTLVSLDAATGSVRWSFATNGSCFEPNVEADGTIVQATTTTLYALNPVDRSVIWQDAIACNGGALVAGDGTIVVISNVATAPRISEVAPSTGAVVAFQTPPPGSQPGIPSSTPLPGYFSLPVAVDGAIYYDQARHVYSTNSSPQETNVYEAASVTTAGQSVWTTGLGSFPNSTPSSIASASVSLSPGARVVTGGYGASLPFGTYGFLSSNGLKSYTNSLPEPSPPSFASDDTAYVVSSGSSLIAFNAATGATVWKLAVSNLAACQPAVGSDGTVYVGTTDGKVVAIR